MSNTACSRLDTSLCRKIKAITQGKRGMDHTAPGVSRSLNLVYTITILHKWFIAGYIKIFISMTLIRFCFTKGN